MTTGEWAPAWRGGFGRPWTAALLFGLLVAAFAFAVALGHASIPLLLAFAFALTTLQTLFDNASTALLPALVAPGPERRQRPPDDRSAGRGRPARRDEHGVERQPGHADAATRTRVDDRPDRAAFRTSSTSGAPLGALLGGAVAGTYGLNGPALLAGLLFTLAVTSLIPVRRPDVPVVVPQDSATPGGVPR